MPERSFLIFWIFWIFLLFFSEFSFRGRVWTEFGTKIFSPFLGISHSVLAKNNGGKKFFSFLNLFSIFFWNFLCEVEYERNSGLIFFSLFLCLSHPFLAKNNAGKRFFKFFEFFCYFFLEFSCRGLGSAVFGPKIFFSFSQPISSCFGFKYCQKEVF